MTRLSTNTGTADRRERASGGKNPQICSLLFQRAGAEFNNHQDSRLQQRL